MPDQAPFTQKEIRVLIADDHPIFRTGMRHVIESDGRCTVEGEAENGEAALRQILDGKPDVAVLDIQMPLMTGLAVSQRVESLNLDTKIILLTMLDDKKIFLEAMERGVKGYLLKDGASEEILRAIFAVSGDRYYISPALSGLLVQKSRAGQKLPSSLSDLTPTEIRVLRLIAGLKSNQEIADEMFISRRTVENHRVNISRKLNLTGTHSLLKFALQHRAELE